MDEIEERNKLSFVCEGFDRKELDELLGRYGEVFLDVPGNTTKTVVKIKTSDNSCFRQALYSVPLGLREEARMELGSLEMCGVIKRYDRLWASPLAPVRKKDGEVKLCLDYRRLNFLTVKEPYYIPGFEDIVLRSWRDLPCMKPSRTSLSTCIIRNSLSSLIIGHW